LPIADGGKIPVGNWQLASCRHLMLSLICLLRTAQPQDVLEPMAAEINPQASEMNATQAA
jgi:hypothetical protein